MGRIILAALIFCLLAYSGNKDDLQLFPPDGYVETWVKADDFQKYTQADLYGYINGGAEVFLELGFEQLTLQDYNNDGTELTAEIYRMSDQIAATGIYLMKCGKEKPAAGLSSRNTINRYQLIFHKNKYFVKISNHSGDENFLPAIVEMANYISERLPSDESILIYDLLPQKGLVENSIRIIRGPFTLQAIYTLGEGDILLFDGVTTGIAADYLSAGDEYFSVILVDYPDENKALKVLENIKTNLNRYLKIINWDKELFVLKDYEEKYVVGKIKKNRLEIRVNLNHINIEE